MTLRIRPNGQPERGHRQRAQMVAELLGLARMKRCLRWDTILTIQEGRCYLCDGEAEPRDRSREHVVPVARGGRFNGNILMACVDCNRIKADRWPTPCELIYLAAVNLEGDEFERYLQRKGVL